MLASYELIPVRDTSAYCLVVTRANQLGLHLKLSSERIKQIVINEWDVILEDAIHKYTQSHTITDYRGYRDLSQSLTTIATICAWKQKIWQ